MGEKQAHSKRKAYLYSLRPDGYKDRDKPGDHRFWIFRAGAGNGSVYVCAKADRT